MVASGSFAYAPLPWGIFGGVQALRRTDHSSRYFNGYIKSIYDLQIVSWLQLFGWHQKNCRVFQDQRLEDIINTLFRPYGRHGKYHINLTEQHPMRALWVQYNETDFVFLQRICARESVAYYFIHENVEHKLQLTDSGYAKALFSEVTVPIRSSETTEEGFTHWHMQSAFVSGRHTLMTYNYKGPAENLTVK